MGREASGSGWLRALPSSCCSVVNRRAVLGQEERVAQDLAQSRLGVLVRRSTFGVDALVAQHVELGLLDVEGRVDGVCDSTELTSRLDGVRCVTDTQDGRVHQGWVALHDTLVDDVTAADVERQTPDGEAGGAQLGGDEPPHELVLEGLPAELAREVGDELVLTVLHRAVAGGDDHLSDILRVKPQRDVDPTEQPVGGSTGEHGRSDVLGQLCECRVREGAGDLVQDAGALQPRAEAGIAGSSLQERDVVPELLVRSDGLDESGEVVGVDLAVGGVAEAFRDVRDHSISEQHDAARIRLQQAELVGAEVHAILPGSVSSA